MEGGKQPTSQGNEHFTLSHLRSAICSTFSFPGRLTQFGSHLSLSASCSPRTSSGPCLNGGDPMDATTAVSFSSRRHLPHGHHAGARGRAALVWSTQRAHWRAHAAQSPHQRGPRVRCLPPEHPPPRLSLVRSSLRRPKPSARRNHRAQRHHPQYNDEWVCQARQSERCGGAVR